VVIHPKTQHWAVRMPVISERTGLPGCSDSECLQFDGKRCRLMGTTPDSLCEPALIDMVEELPKVKADYAAALTELRTLKPELERLRKVEYDYGVSLHERK
jgi:hypothetical protein